MPQSFDEAFDSFDDCVATLGSKEGIDDPEKLCGWLQEHGFEAISQTGAKQILSDLSVEYVSVVDTPAQRSEWLLAKDEDGPDDVEEYSRWESPYLVRKLDDETPEDSEAERKVWAAVLVPGESDKQDDLVPEHEIEAAAHEYLRDYRKVDEDHTLRDGAGVPIESYIVRDGSAEFETPDGSTVEYPVGTWIMGVQVGPDEWDRIKSGDLNGFSIYGGASPLRADDLLTENQKQAILSMQGTEKAVDAEDAATVLSVLDDYVSSGATPEDATIAALAEWVAEDAPEDVVDSSTIVESDADDSSDDEESDSEDDEDEDDAEKDTNTETDMSNESDGSDGDEETNDLLKEVRDTVQETQKSVESHGEKLDELDDRVSSLEKDEGDGDGEESDSEDDEEGESDEDAASPEEVEDAAEKAVEKKFREAFGVDEDEDLDEVVRKYEFENNADEETGIDLSLDGITEGEA